MPEFKTFFSVKTLTCNFFLKNIFIFQKMTYKTASELRRLISVFGPIKEYEDFPSYIDTFYLNHTLMEKQTISTVYSF